MARFVVQEHRGRRLHWDFRLEVDGMLKSWAVPKGPSLDSAQRRLAIQVEDHDMAHADYEGVIPEGTYGAGPVIIWDKGHYEALEDPEQGLANGHLEFMLHGRILKGRFVLLKLRARGRANAWLLVKEMDAQARPGWVTPDLLTPQVEARLEVKAPICASSEP